MPKHCYDLDLWHYRLSQIVGEMDARDPDNNDLLCWVGMLRRVANQMEAHRYRLSAPVPTTGTKERPMKST